MYDQFYGLSGRPFQLTPDPQYYFESGTHRKALSYLGYGLAQGEGFIVITGEVGSGKSTLVGHLMQTIDRARLTAATIVTSQLDAVDLVQMVAESYGIDTRGLDKASALKAIENFLHAEARAGRRCLLVVDEAQNLAIDALEELRMLSNFQLGSMPLLQIFLLGQPEFRDLVKTAPELEQLRQRVIATHHLEAMDADEVQPYVQHRLRKAGWTGRPQLSDDAYAALYDETTGIPRKLNALMNRCLLMGAVEQIDMIDGPLVGAVIADMAGKPFAYEAPMSSQAPALAVDLPAVVVDAAEEPAAAIDSANVVAMPSHLAAVPTISAGVDVSLQARIAEMEVRMAEQDATMRRVLAMLIDWMEKENHSMAARMRDVRAA
ncbi:MAG: XrtA-associated ATPase [Sphingobium sp.]|nr:MAG: XrtA-associated ATPase [Sphingobium sp.]